MQEDFSNSDIDIPETKDEDSGPLRPVENLVSKGDYFDIRKKIPGLQNIAIGSGWDVKLFEEESLDVDLSCFLLNKAEQTREDTDFIFYNNESTCAGGVRHQGDSRTGAGDGDDEMINIDLNALPFDIIKITFVLSIYNAAEREQHFGKIRNMYFRMVNDDDGNEIFRFVMNEGEYVNQIGIKVGEMVREGPKWFFNVLGEPIPGGLAKIATQYGIIVTTQ